MKFLLKVKVKVKVKVKAKFEGRKVEHLEGATRKAHAREVAIGVC